MAGKIIRKIGSVPIFLALVAIPLALTWRSNFFFMSDDWTALLQMADNPFWRYLNRTDAEQWFPFFHFCYYLLIKISGEHYNLLIVVNCVGTGINAFLVYLFFRRHLDQGPALVLSLIYSGAVVHGAVIYQAYNLCYLLSFGFFMGALLLADAYLAAPSRGRLAGLGICALLAILSHSFAIMALATILLYVWLLGEGRGPFKQVALVLGLVYLVFAAGYTTFAGVEAASSHNRQMFAQIPGLSYFLFLLFGAFFFPFYFLLGGTLVGGKYVLAPILGIVALAVILPLIFGKGESRARRLAIWVMVMNPTLFLLVGLARYQLSISQVGTLRYGVFTIVGPLLLLGLAWQTVSRLPQRRWARPCGLAVVGLIFAVQMAASLNNKASYLRMSGMTRLAYENLDKQLKGSPQLEQDEARQLFIPKNHPWLTRGEALRVRRFLQGEQPDR